MNAVLLGYCGLVFAAALAFWGWVGWSWLKFEWPPRRREAAMHTLNLIAMAIGYASLAFMLGVVIACVVCWFSGVTRPTGNAEKAGKSQSPPTLRQATPILNCQPGESRLSLVPGGRQGQ